MKGVPENRHAHHAIILTYKYQIFTPLKSLY